MDKQQFRQKLKELGLTQRQLAKDLDLTKQQVTNWNKKNSYPMYVVLYFENIRNREKLKDIRSKTKSLNDIYDTAVRLINKIKKI